MSEQQNEYGIEADLQSDKKLINYWIGYHLYCSPNIKPLKKYRAQMLLIDMQKRLERLLYKFKEDVSRL